MSRKYTFKLAPKLAFNIYLPSSVKYGGEGLLTMLLYLQPRFWKFFLVFLFPVFFVTGTQDFGASHLLFLYAFVVLILFTQIMLKLLGKGDFLPTVSYDLLLLTYTSVIAISLLLAVVNSQNTFALWGGGLYRIISGLSIIAYWFLYYLTNIFGRQEGMLRRSIELIAISAMIAFVVSLANALLEYPYPLGVGIFHGYVLLMPVWLLLSLSSVRLNKLFFVNFVISIVLLGLYPAIEFVIGLLVAFSVLLLIELLSNKGKIKQLTTKFSKDFDLYSDNQIKLFSIPRRNKSLVKIVFSVVFIALSLLWLLSNRTLFVFPLLEAGLPELQKLVSVQHIIFGNGLFSEAGGTIITELVRSYGLLSFVVFFSLLLVILRDQFKVLITSKNDYEKALSKSVLTFVPASIVVFALSWTTELHLIIFWIWIGIAGVLKSRVLDNEYLKFEHKYINLSSIKNKNTRRFVEIARFVAILLIIVAVGYFFNLLNSIQVFIN